MTQVDKLVHSLRAELNRLRERVETQARYTDVIERKLREAMKRSGAGTPSVEVADPILPLNGGIRLPATQSEGPAATFDSRSPGARAAAAGTDESWWPRGERSARPLVPNAGWQNHALHGRVTKVVGISVCGLPRAVLEGVIDSIAAQQGRLRDFAPVFLTDSTDFDLFRRHGFVFEYLPAPDRRAGCSGTATWDDYAAQRRALLERKWGMDHVICFGPSEFGRPAAETSVSPAAGAALPGLSDAGSGRSPQRAARLRHPAAARPDRRSRKQPDAPVEPAASSANAAEGASRATRAKRAARQPKRTRAGAHRANGQGSPEAFGEAAQDDRTKVIAP